MSTETDDATVFIVDDDDSIREGLAMLVESVGLAAQEFENAQAFLAELDSGGERLGCLVVDIRMPGMSGLELQERLVELDCALPVIILTGFGDVPVVVRAMKQGAVDFVEKPYQPDELLERIRGAIETCATRLSTRNEASAVQARLGSLTPREREVLDLVVGGAANKVVAIELGISERTVEIHRSRVMKKMGARSLAQLVHLIEQMR